MRVVDTSPCNRAFQLNSTEQLTSEFLTAAFILRGHTMAEATEEAARVFDVVEEQLLEDRTAA